MKVFGREIHKYLLAFLMIFLFSVAMIRINEVSAATTKLYVDPPNVLNTTLLPPSTFTVAVKVANVVGLYGVQFTLGWNPTILYLTKVTLSFPWSNFFLATNQTDENAGQYTLIVTSITTAFSGNTTFATLVYRVAGVGSTPLSLTDTTLGDAQANLIPHDDVDGFFSNVEVIPALVYVQPPSIIDPTLLAPKNFTVAVNIAKVSGLYSFDLKLSYNKAILGAIQIAEGSFLESFGTTIVNKMQNDPINGIVWVAISLQTPAPAASGNGTLCSITFEVEQKGNSTLHLFDTLLKDKVNNAIVYTTSDGYFNNALLAKLYVDPPIKIDPALTPATTFTVDIKIANITNLYGYQFDLLYDTSFLNGIGILTYPHPSNETHFTSHVQIDDRNGHIFVNVSYYRPAMEIASVAPLTLARITFQVQSFGSSVLHLQNEKLVDSFGGSIVHVTADGFVSVALPHVGILSVSANPTTVYSGSHVNVTVVAANLGIFRMETFNVTVYRNSTVFGMTTVTNLPPKTNITLPFDWDTTGIPPGDYPISARASVVPLETNMTDHFLMDGIVHVAVPAVAVLSVKPELNTVYQGWKINITVVVQNQGPLPISFQVETYYDTNIIGTQSISSLPSFTNATLVFIWDTATAPYCHNYTISAKVSLPLGQTNSANGTFVDGKVKVRIMGDVNGDGKVNVLDLISVSIAFQTHPGDRNYNFYSDLNRDKNINVLDMILVATHLGLSC
jgi:hypothetical protein